MKQLWYFAKLGVLDADSDKTAAKYHCNAIECNLWIYIEKSIQNKHHSLFNKHKEYNKNNIHKTCTSGILNYTKRIQDMHELDHYLSPPSKKFQEYREEEWGTRNKNLTEDEIGMATRDNLPLWMRNDIEHKDQELCSLQHE